MRRLFLALSVVVLLASLVIHLLTFTTASPLSMPLMFLMQLIVLVLCFAAFYFARHVFPKRRGLPVSFSAIMAQQQEVQQFWRGFLRPVPLWARVLFCLLFAYVAFNFTTNIPPPDFSSVKASGGRYYEIRKNGTQTELTQGQYDARMRQQVRMFSGAWLIFSLFPVLFFGFIAPASEQKKTGGDDAGFGTRTA